MPFTSDLQPNLTSARRLERRTRYAPPPDWIVQVPRRCHAVRAEASGSVPSPLAFRQPSRAVAATVARFTLLHSWAAEAKEAASSLIRGWARTWVCGIREGARAAQQPRCLPLLQAPGSCRACSHDRVSGKRESDPASRGFARRISATGASLGLDTPFGESQPRLAKPCSRRRLNPHRGNSSRPPPPGASALARELPSVASQPRAAGGNGRRRLAPRLNEGRGQNGAERS